MNYLDNRLHFSWVNNDSFNWIRVMAECFYATGESFCKKVKDD